MRIQHFSNSGYIQYTIQNCKKQVKDDQAIHAARCGNFSAVRKHSCQMCVCVCVCVRAHVFIYLECFEQFDIDTQGRLKNYRNAFCR